MELQEPKVLPQLKGLPCTLHRLTEYPQMNQHFVTEQPQIGQHLTH